MLRVRKTDKLVSMTITQVYDVKHPMIFWSVSLLLHFSPVQICGFLFIYSFICLILFIYLDPLSEAFLTVGK